MSPKEVNMSVVDDVLKHYGVRGMRWGVNRSSGGSGGPGPKSVQLTQKGTKLTSKGGSNHVPAHEALQAAAYAQKAKKSGTHSLTNEQLRLVVNRMNLEQQYSKLSANSGQRNAGAKFASDILGNVAKQQLTKLASEMAAQQLAAVLSKK